MAREGVSRMAPKKASWRGTKSVTSIFPLYAFTKFPEKVEGAVKYQATGFVSVPERPDESATALNFTGFPSRRFSVHPAVSPSLNPPCDGPDFSFNFNRKVFTQARHWRANQGMTKYIQMNSKPVRLAQRRSQPLESLRPTKRITQVDVLCKFCTSCKKRKSK
jgi:hypothetical protein